MGRKRVRETKDEPSFYGPAIGNGRPWTLEEIAAEFRISRERVRQIEQRALKKLKHPARAWLIRDFLGE
jgi:DNA-directed RNA polymerase sigma subunit (sigma70/sigma32)